MKIFIIRVQGMKCESCENRIVNALTKLKGISKVKANYKEQVIEVTTNHLDFNIIQEKIEDIGFSVIDKTVKK